MPFRQIISVVYSYCTRVVVQVKNAMTSASPERPQLHRYFRPPEDRVALMTICAVIDEYVAEGEYSSSMMVEELRHCKQPDHPQHEFLLAKLTSITTKFVGFAIIERGRGKAVVPATDGKKLIPTPSNMQLDSSDNGTTSESDVVLDTITSPSTPSGSNSSPTMCPPPARRRPSIGYSFSVASPSLEPHHADDIIILSRSKENLLKRRPNSRVLRRWSSTSPNAQSITFSQLLAACSVTSSWSPTYDLMKTQCFYFAGVILQLVTNGQGIREENSSAGRFRGVSMISPVTVASIANQLRSSFEEKVAEIDGKVEAKVEQARKQAGLEARVEAAEKDKEVLERDKEVLERDKEVLERDKEVLERENRKLRAELARRPGPST